MLSWPLQLLRAAAECCWQQLLTDVKLTRGALDDELSCSPLDCRAALSNDAPILGTRQRRQSRQLGGGGNGGNV